MLSDDNNLYPSDLNQISTDSIGDNDLLSTVKSWSLEVQ